MADSFFAMLETELLNRRFWPTRAAWTMTIFEYIAQKLDEPWSPISEVLSAVTTAGAIGSTDMLHSAVPEERWTAFLWHAQQNILKTLLYHLDEIPRVSRFGPSATDQNKGPPSSSERKFDTSLASRKRTFLADRALPFDGIGDPAQSVNNPFSGHQYIPLFNITRGQGRGRPRSQCRPSLSPFQHRYSKWIIVDT